MVYRSLAALPTWPPEWGVPWDLEDGDGGWDLASWLRYASSPTEPTACLPQWGMDETGASPSHPRLQCWESLQRVCRTWWSHCGYKKGVVRIASLALVMSRWLNMFDTYPGIQKIRPKNKVLVRVLLIVSGRSVLSSSVWNFELTSWQVRMEVQCILELWVSWVINVWQGCQRKVT